MIEKNLHVNLFRLENKFIGADEHTVSEPAAIIKQNTEEKKTKKRNQL